MPIRFDKNGAMVRVSYCSCDNPEVERRGSRQTPHCTLCDRHCPDEEAIFHALRDLESIEVLRKRQYKKTNYRTGKIEAVMTEARGQSNTKTLMDLYGTNEFRSVVKRLWMRGRFRAGYTTQDLDCLSPAPDAEEESVIVKPTGDTPEKSEWELLVPADAPAEASAYDAGEEETPAEAVSAEDAPTEEAPTKEVSAEYGSSPEDEIPTAEAYPMEAYNEDPPAEAKSAEVDEACECDCVQEEQKAIYLPLSSQHKSMILLQEVLEGACFAYGKKRLAILLREREWDCVEAVALRTWMDQLASIQHIFGAVPGKDLFESVASIQDVATSRTPINSSRMKKLLNDAVRLTEILEVKDYSDIVKRVRLGIEMAIEGLSREEHEAEEQQSKKLKRIAEERLELDRREADVRDEQERAKRGCRKSTELEVRSLLGEAKKSLETVAFFSQ
ncbi:hypothetical protein IWW34DRAFT_772650 [Fusarium oxysporum f. sp. albedinis]|uniref:Uncharacterized protein n=1 Tax=Fusarium oxysporum f. sp. cepae TaxID=396571 RepID=A0A3L6N1R4_FUSOX|nr:hypothetical protein IWW34DRAFT_772650 [Fusarium oxysporum f. sp. albedinis]RKK10777.1 hypothetical protein BFJ65_g14773 [Fusarium oxysporum f. sp. cepae]RKK23525.1 hypothetical protein BFJ67_g17130 [Fusarium oxysporum f. sp. cepae]RKK24092.1 hypothetical protein BFJ66_g17230 [Fusarium oxysporum f. sp. cepae]